ncbi:PhoH family protein [Candidatus Proelusimicrobium excrementi]|uniref:PhoH family protein n=1 Tax=Candidatus Proelusimicrobium excrementi TaxID=3416222 RepID=UPI003C84BCAF|nr:PhoH family protein [Elusimicrobiaceae bacterium]
MIKKIKLLNKDEIYAILGVQDRNLKALEKEFKITVTISYDDDNGDAELSLNGLHSRVDKAYAKIQKNLDILRVPPAPNASAEEKVPFAGGVVFRPAHASPVKPRTQNQNEYIKLIWDRDLIICTGPAGTGKTFLAAACALRALQLGMTGKIVVTRPIVEAGEKLGFLPGDINEKVDPYLRPVYDAFQAMLGAERFNALRDAAVIEIVPLAYMRGRTLENAFIILDEAQNASPEQIKMFLTRMGLNSKIIVTGDITQIDLPSSKQSGLISVKKILGKVPQIGFFEFENADIVRHPLVKEIIQAYDKWEKKCK